MSARTFDRLMRFFKMDKKTRLIDVDFSRPWWHILLQQKGAFALVYTIGLASNAFLTLPAFFVEWIFRSSHYEYFIFFVFIWLGFIVLDYIAGCYAARAQTQSIQGIHYTAMQTILNSGVEPQVDIYKGKIIAKVYRGAESLSEILRMMGTDFLSISAGVGAVIITFLMIDVRLGLLTFVLLACISVIFVGVFMATAHVMMPSCIEADDDVKNAGTETLVHLARIRETQSLYRVACLLRDVNKRRLGIEATLWRSYYVIAAISNALYVLVFAIIGVYIFGLVQHGTIAVATGMALLITFFDGTYQLLTIGQYVYRFKVYLESINDLFDFMRKYGQRSTFVLSDNKKKKYFFEL